MSTIKAIQKIIDVNAWVNVVAATPTEGTWAQAYANNIYYDTSTMDGNNAANSALATCNSVHVRFHLASPPPPPH